MIYVIVAINLSITLLNIYIALRIWQIRLITARITAILINYENYFNLVLSATPQLIYQGQNNLNQVRKRYQLLQLQVTKTRQLIWLVNWSFQIWRKSQI